MCLQHGVLTLHYYRFLQQSNLSNPPTPPASLPPTPPPVNRQKMINGFATTEELASKAVMGRNTGGCTLMSLSSIFSIVCPYCPTISHCYNWFRKFIQTDIILLFYTVSKGLVPKPLHVPFRTEEDLLARAIGQGPKTVDVPASLPTPPHNNQEELRYWMSNSNTASLRAVLTFGHVDCPSNCVI